MAKRYLFVGGKAAFCPRTITGAVDSTAATYRDTAWTDSAIRCTEGGSVNFPFTDAAGNPDPAMPGETLWMRYDFGMEGGVSTNSYNWLTIHNLAGNNVLSVRNPPGASPKNQALFYYDGTNWVQIGPSGLVGNVGEMVIRLQIGTDGNHRATGWINGEPWFLPTNFTLPSLTGVSYMRGVCGYSVFVSNYSQIIAAVGINLIGSKVKTLKPDAAGTTNTLTAGTFADIDDTTTNDADYLTSEAPGQKATFGFTDMPPIPEGLISPNILRYAIRAKTEGSVVTKIKPIVRLEGVDTVGPAITLSEGYEGYSVEYPLTPAQVNAVGFELGLETAE